MARTGHERFTNPTVAGHRRYEALRAYYVEELSAAEIAERFGYTKASVQTLISQYRHADVGELFQASRPGPKRQPKKDAARERALELRRSRHGTEAKRHNRCAERTGHHAHRGRGRVGGGDVRS